MRICLAGTYSRSFLADTVATSPYLLESFFYFQEWQAPLLKKAELFLIDSGGFTFMHRGGDHDHYAYLKRYIEFVNRYDVKYFFELDLDYVIGYEKTLKYRELLEKETGKKCIPVFHKQRGLKGWYEMCENYDYVSIGTMAEYRGREHILDELIKIAKEYNTKVHGLGYTSKLSVDQGFYSVDSTSWLSGSRYGNVYKFTGNDMLQYKRKNYKTIHYKEVDRHNLEEWVKYQKYVAMKKGR